MDAARPFPVPISSQDWSRPETGAWIEDARDLPELAVVTASTLSETVAVGDPSSTLISSGASVAETLSASAGLEGSDSGSDVFSSLSWVETVVVRTGGLRLAGFPLAFCKGRAGKAGWGLFCRFAGPERDSFGCLRWFGFSDGISSARITLATSGDETFTGLIEFEVAKGLAMSSGRGLRPSTIMGEIVWAGVIEGIPQSLRSGRLSSSSPAQSI
jgi:hypothetical protein